MAAARWLRGEQGIPSPTSANSTIGWRVGDPTNNLTARGTIPSWSAVRQRIWKSEAFYNSEMYAEEDIARMRLGLAPQRVDPLTGKTQSMELHHDPPQRVGGLFDVNPVWPADHARLDPFRNLGK